MQTYIERDIRELLRIEKRREFETFVKLCALRTGQVVNYDDLARDAGVSAATAKSWLSLLEDGFLIRLVWPFFSNRARRMIKSPRLYFLDAGLAAWLWGAGGARSSHASGRWAAPFSRRTGGLPRSAGGTCSHHGFLGRCAHPVR